MDGSPWTPATSGTRSRRSARHVSSRTSGSPGSVSASYVQANAHAEALSEFETCQQRRGEAMAVFFDDVPTTRYLPPLAYWLARTQEGLEQRSAAAANYRRFLDLRAAASTDPLAADARQRLSALK